MREIRFDFDWLMLNVTNLAVQLRVSAITLALPDLYSSR